MKRILTREKIRPYIWAISIFFILSFGHSITQYPDHFFETLFNNLWHISYVIVLNFILFEYSVPFVFRKRGFLIYNILLGILLLFVYMILYSYGAYAWRSLGIHLRIYTPFGTFKSLSELLQNQWHIAWALSSFLGS